MGTEFVDGADMLTDTSWVLASQNASRNDSTDLARTFHQTLADTEATYAGANAGTVDPTAANSLPAGGTSDVDLLNGSPTNDPNYQQAQMFWFRPMPLGPLGRIGPRVGPMDEVTPYVRPNPPVTQPPKIAPSPKPTTPVEPSPSPQTSPLQGRPPVPPVTIEPQQGTNPTPQEPPAKPDTGPKPDGTGSGDKIPPNGNGIRTDGDCDNWKTTESPRTRLPRTDGRWDGEPGNSNWHSTNPDVNQITGGRPIRFTNGRPDFTPWARFSVNLPEGTLTGTHNADANAVLKHLTSGDNPAFKTQAEAQRYLTRNGLTPHHASDTCIQLVPTELNSGVAHIGSASGLRNK